VLPLPLFELPEVLLELLLPELLFELLLLELLRLDPLPLLLRLELLLPPPRPELPRAGRSESLLLERLGPLELLLELLLLDPLELPEPPPPPPRLPCARAAVELITPAPSRIKAIRNARWFFRIVGFTHGLLGVNRKSISERRAETLVSSEMKSRRWRELYSRPKQ